MKNFLKKSLIFINFQWQDRKKTSSFLFGITLQTLILTLATMDMSKSADEAFSNSIRAYYFTVVNIMMFAAMSNLSNEFRFSTISSVVISQTSLNRLILYRSLANVFVSLPALLIPMSLTFYRFPSAFSIRSLTGIGMALGFVVVLCYFSSYVFSMARNPNSVMPWLRYYFLILGLSIIPGLDFVANLLPMGWTYKIIQNDMVLRSLGFYTLTMLPYVLIPMLAIEPYLDKRIEQQLAKGSLRL